METSVFREQQTQLLRFKSYYVVWKLERLKILLRLKGCLNRTMQYGNDNTPNPNKINGFGLNRTMQYGNTRKENNKSGSKKGLNRTMQYGNVQAMPSFGRNTVRLNRTMQYGNINKLYLCLTATWFKSYYVVWKLFNQRKGIHNVSGLNRTMQYGNFLGFLCVFDLMSV